MLSLCCPATFIKLLMLRPDEAPWAFFFPKDENEQNQTKGRAFSF